jgi:hypothetical protein
MGNPDLKFHPLANIFPLLEGQEFEDLVADIKAHGLIEPIVIYQDQILDGRNRYRACVAAGIDCCSIPYTGNDPVGYVVSKNIRRRHLTAERKRELIAKLVKAKPEASNLQIAKQVKADDKTVAKVRSELEARSEIPNVKTRTDTKGRKQPRSKPKNAPNPSSPVKTDPIGGPPVRYQYSPNPDLGRFQQRTSRSKILVLGRWN